MLDSVIGQEDRLIPLKTAIEAAHRDHRELPDMLILGNSGLGKTHLARAIAEEMYAEFHVLHAPSITEPKQLADKILESSGGILFIDEIHALNRALCEDLYTVIDSNEIAVEVPVTAPMRMPRATDNPAELDPANYIGVGIVWETVEMPTKEKRIEHKKIGGLTVIGATTDESLLPTPFLNRLSRLKVFLRDYNLVELGTIGIMYVDEVGGYIEEKAAMILATRALGNPRRMKQLVERALDLDRAVTFEVATRAVDSLGVDVLGLEPPHRAILEALRGTDGLSRTSLGQKVGLPPRNLDYYWSDLLKLGLVTIDTRHRLTLTGKEHISSVYR